MEVLRGGGLCPSCGHWRCADCTVEKGIYSSSTRPRPMPSHVVAQHTSIPETGQGSAANFLFEPPLLHRPFEAKSSSCSGEESGNLKGDLLVEHTKDDEEELRQDNNPITDESFQKTSEVSSASTTIAAGPLHEEPQLLDRRKGLPTSIDLPDNSTVRRRPGGRVEARRPPAQSAPSTSRDEDPSRGLSFSQEEDTGRSDQSNLSQQTLQGSGDPDDNPSSPALNTSQRPKRSPLWLIWAIITCISIGLLSLAIMFFATANATNSEKAMCSCPALKANAR